MDETKIESEKYLSDMPISLYRVMHLLRTLYESHVIFNDITGFNDLFSDQEK